MRTNNTKALGHLFILLIAILFVFALAVQAQTDDLPPNPVPGKCYVKCITKDTYKTVEETIEIAPAFKTLKIVPATYKIVEDRVMVKEASKKLVYVPAVYKTVEETYESKEGSTNLTVVPAAFGSSSKTVEIASASAGWQYTTLADCPSVNKEDCMVVCYVETPAKSETIQITTLTNDAATTSVEVPGAKATYKKQIVVTPARMEEIEIPAEYATIKRQVVDRPARIEEVVTPAKYRTISKTSLDKKGGMAVWEEVDCGLVGTYNALPIQYDYNSAVITAASKRIIDDNLFKLMQDKPNLNIEILSHTDSRGNAEYNMALSQQRAQSVVNYLVSKGIASSRLVAKGFGETRLKNRCADGVECSEAEHQVNRRTEFRILN